MATRTGVVFLGEYEHALDDKGRLTVPSKFRAGLGEPFVVTRGLDGCLFAYPMDTWQSISSDLDALPFTSANARMFTRMIYSGAVEVTTDRQGRFLVPNNLRQHAALDKDTVLIGVSNRVEIWSRERWDVFCAQAEADYQASAEQLFQGKSD